MKIELKEKTGYEWVECDISDYYGCPLNQECAILNVWGNRKYYLLQQIKPKYDCSYFEDQRLIDELTMAEHTLAMSSNESSRRVWIDRSQSIRCEILRRMNREQS